MSHRQHVRQGEIGAKSTAGSGFGSWQFVQAGTAFRRAAKLMPSAAEEGQPVSIYLMFDVLGTTLDLKHAVVGPRARIESAHHFEFTPPAKYGLIVLANGP